jgi:hypothetical protein
MISAQGGRRLADCSTSREGRWCFMNYVTFGELFAFALVIIGVIALLKNKDK